MRFGNNCRVPEKVYGSNTLPREPSKNKPRLTAERARNVRMAGIRPPSAAGEPFGRHLYF